MRATSCQHEAVGQCLVVNKMLPMGLQKKPAWAPLAPLNDNEEMV